MTRVPIYLMALIVAIAGTPLDIYAINAWNHGIEKVEPWRGKICETPIIERLASRLTRLREWVAEFANVPLLHEELGVLVIAGDGRRIKQLLQAKADAFKAMGAARDKIAAAKTDEERSTAKAEFKAAQTTFDAVAEDLADEEKFAASERAMRPVDEGHGGLQGTRIQVGDFRPDKDPKRGFETHTEFMLTVMHAAQHGEVDERLAPLTVKGERDVRRGRFAAAGSDEQSGNEGQYGAFLVPAGFTPSLLQVTPEDDPTAGLVTPMPMTNPIVTVPARTDKDHTTSVSGGLIVTRKRETVAATSARMSLEQVVFHANSAFGLSYSTEEILVDSPISFVFILSAGFKDQFASFLFNERLNGTGSGEPLGILNSPALVSVAKETNQATKTIVTENIDKMVASSWRYGKSMWLANHDTFPQLQGLSRAIGVGGALTYYLQPSNDASGPDFKLLGRPIYFSEYPATLGTVGDILLVQWSEYIHATYQPLESAESIHVRFETHERTFKFWLRDDGQPWWKSALTPKRGANKLSPYVALAAR